MIGEMRKSSYARVLTSGMMGALLGMGGMTSIMQDVRKAMYPSGGNFIASGQRAHLKSKCKGRRTR